MKRKLHRMALLSTILAGSLLATGCLDDEGTLTAPAPGGDLFARYVALGNSITAGMQSSGLNDSLQLRAYPVLVAKQANAQFGIPLFNKPGCPPPYTQPVLISTARLGGAQAPPCSLRSTPVPAFVQNLAVPGTFLGGALDLSVLLNPAQLGFLKTFILGGKSEVERMLELQPTLVSVWLGNNDVLEASTIGDTTRATTVASFSASVDELVTALKKTPAGSGQPNRDVVLIGIAPIAGSLQPGAFYFLARDATGRVGGKPVNNNCSPVTLLGQPNPLSANLIHFAVLSDPTVPEISCAPDAPYLLNAAELQSFIGRIVGYNTALSAAASANGWIYIDPNKVFAGADATPVNFRQVADPSQFRFCQGLATATTAAQFQQAVLTTCPGPSPTGDVSNFFGSYLSFDATHPSSQFHVALADAIIAAINAKHNLNIPQI